MSTCSAGTASHGVVVLASGEHLVAADADAGDVFAVVHPNAVSLHRRHPEGSPRNVWRGSIEGLDLLGDRVRVRIAAPLPLIAEVTAAAVRELGLDEGVEVWASVKATEVAVYAA